MKLYCTKWVLTKGVAQFEEEPNIHGYFKFSHECFSINSKHIHHSLESAQCMADEIRKSKIESLKKQIAKLEKMKF